jgi:hypothetical protein
MDGTNAVQYADALDKTVTVVERILQSPLSLPIFLFLLVIVACIVIIVLMRNQAKMNKAAYTDLNTRLQACEARHSTRDADLDDCEKRDRRNMIAIATLHGIVCTLQESLPADHPRRRKTDGFQIPSLEELMSGDPKMAARFNPAAMSLTK